MPHDVAFGDGPFEIVIRVTGTVTLDEMLDGRRKLLEDPRLRPEMTALYDYSAADTRNLTGDDMRRYVEGGDAERPRFKAVAIVAPDDVTFGFSRMFTILAELEGYAGTRVAVRTVAEAEAWLQTLDD